ncbi:MAG: transglutaminase family protein [Acidimicrobiia bacterium]|nr:transglutaminase family protein [Acidimicrobiia bacterium]
MTDPNPPQTDTPSSNTIAVHAQLDYDLATDASFAFAVAAARTARQHLENETISLDPTLDYTIESYGEAGSHQLIRFDAPVGHITLSYDATAVVHPRSDRSEDLTRTAFGAIPADLLPFVNPSRYCESDTLTALATRLFGGVDPGYATVQAVNDWVGSEILYLPGTTDATTSAVDVLVQRSGVCRDFAHVAISLCRALGIPARYVSGYGIGVEPQDFHGFFEAYLSGDWWLFDPTGMAAVDHLVRIGYGRDAGDASFATFVGQANLTSKIVTVTEQGDPSANPSDPDTATSTA